MTRASNELIVTAIYFGSREKILIKENLKIGRFCKKKSI